jgi:hypothetical protein
VEHITEGGSIVATQPQPTPPTQPTFSFLQGLTVVVPPRGAGTKQGDPLTAAKNRVIAGAKAQKTYVQLLIDGKELPKMDGGKKTVSVWFYRAADGSYETRLRYGQSAIPLDGTKTGVRVGDLKALIPFYDAVIAGIERGELDEKLHAMQQAKSAALTQTGA